MIESYQSKPRLLYFWLVPVLLLLFPAMCMAQVHTVAKGDDIAKLSELYNVNQYVLRYNNDLWTDSINIGQKLHIPVRYIVQPGDSFGLIGKKFGVEADSIKNSNQLKSDRINPGQVLFIPTKAHGNIASGPSVLNNDDQVSRGDTRLSMEDFDLLARIITAEADSESYTTQVAVGATVLNRVASPLFPNSISGVVYQVDQNAKYQFEPVLNGFINNPASESGKKAASPGGAKRR